tara:strand:- start:48 stop:185 length:138 start_codon:yes stop_codon:yes gene_type:complete
MEAPSRIFVLPSSLSVATERKESEEVEKKRSVCEKDGSDEDKQKQ